MQISTFRYYFKRLSGVFISDKVVLFRKPLQLYSLATDKVIADFKSLDDAFAFTVGSKTLAQIINGWKRIPIMAKNGGRGGGSGMGFSGGWPTFSKEDVIATAMEGSRGIVAVSTPAGRSADTAKYAGTYTFVKGQRFNASGFVKGVNSAKLSGKDYNDAVDKWLRANQKKYGYTYTYVKAK